MQRIALLLMLYAAGTYAIWADEASRRAKVEEYMRLTKIDEMYAKSTAAIGQQMQDGSFLKMMGLDTATPEQQAIGKRAMAAVQKVVEKYLSWEKLKPDYMQIFAETFSEQELDDLIAFYRTPSGRALVEKTPAMMEKTNLVVQRKMGDMQAEMRATIEALVKEATSKKN